MNYLIIYLSEYLDQAKAEDKLRKLYNSYFSSLSFDLLFNSSLLALLSKYPNYSLLRLILDNTMNFI